MLAQLSRTEGTVEPDEQRPGVADAVPERLDGLAREGPPGRVDDRARDDQRYPLADLVEDRLDGEDRRLRVEGVEDRLDEQEVCAAFEEPGGGLTVGDLQLGPGHVARGRVVHVRAERGGTVRRSEGARDETRPVGVGQLRGVGGRASEPCRGHVHLAHDLGREAVVRLGNARRGEGIRRDDVGAGVEVAGVHGADGVGLRQAQQVVVAAEVARVVAEPLTLEVGLAELARLEHRAHGAVEDEDPLPQQVGQARQAAGPGERRSGAPGGDRHATGSAPAGASAASATSGITPTSGPGWRARIRVTSPAHCS